MIDGADTVSPCRGQPSPPARLPFNTCLCFSSLLLLLASRRRQFTTHITGKHVGFPQSELTTLFTFFQRTQRTARVHTSTPATITASSRESHKGPVTQGRQAKTRTPPSRRVGIRCGIGGSGSGGGSSRSDASAGPGADWVDAVACLRLLAKPKEPVLSAILGVFEVFARSAGDRARCARRLEHERVEKERQRELKEERERWKRRRRREQEGRGMPAEVRGVTIIK